MQQTANVLPDMYEADETAWLESMSELIQQGRLGELDYPHLSEYLADMARRDRREVESRLAMLLTHVLKWDYQPKKRSKSWRNTIIVQRQELARLLVSGVLRNHAEAVLGDIYLEAIARAATQTKLPPGTFPEECPYTLDQVLSADVREE